MEAAFFRGATQWYKTPRSQRGAYMTYRISHGCGGKSNFSFLRSTIGVFDLLFENTDTVMGRVV